MNREEIRQKVFDALGIILVDKSAIQDDATLADLALDDEDIERFFSALEEAFDFTLPEAIRRQATARPDQLALDSIVKLILHELKKEPGKSEEKHGHQH
ncbi:hypothetical protein [Pseudomonas syringae]|uniref:hypothetical protein n=1 Tax=Pseudomonas syringae TaxID=317 RepID=UPI0018E60948|nr:hypothetical protein [Pseudomonas syringae]MBI6717410.1 hypothetical protein [Pseudomonas syringae]MBI6758365.1 hypothetical protein [Pseudomonas syringae]